LQLGERDHLTNVVLAGENRNQSVDAKGEATVRRRSVAERLQKESEPAVSLIIGNAEVTKHSTLELRLMNPDAAGAELPAVEHQVVRKSANGHWVRLEPVEVVRVRVAERMVTWLRTAGLWVDTYEQRELDDPHVAIWTLVHRRTREVVAQLAEYCARRRPVICHNKQEVARDRA
jgi:hypothetical protein